MVRRLHGTRDLFRVAVALLLRRQRLLLPCAELCFLQLLKDEFRPTMLGRSGLFDFDMTQLIGPADGGIDIHLRPVFTL